MEQKSGVWALLALLVLTLFLCFLLETCEKPPVYIANSVQMYGVSLFLTLPRDRKQQPLFSLAQTTPSGLKPFPNARAHSDGTLMNAVDICLDCNGTLWVLDCGVDSKERLIRSSPKIVAIDADSGEILQEINISRYISGRAQYLTVDERPRGPKYLYISDGPARSIAVYNIGTHKGHVVVLPKIVSAQKAVNILYTALVGKKLYLTYFGSLELYYLETSGLFNNGQVVRVGSKDPRMILLGTRDHEIIFRMAGRPEILSWDTRKKLLEKNLNIIDKGKKDTHPMAVVNDMVNSGYWRQPIIS